ncbi:ABC transporter ATP-binding protein [Rhodococcus olei]|uniref:ABC transporter ATP-binding protein n=1 Tax=Rhodococcus olei TaxID=2161675 RepID=A0ABP8NVH9_9NOCA
MSAALQIEELSVRYGDSVAVDQVSLTMQPGECLAILGANGAGKSSLAAAIARVVTSTTGSIIIDGQEVSAWSAHRLVRSGVAYLPEQRAIFPGLLVEENLRLAVRRMTRDHRRSAIEDAFDLFPVLRDRREQTAATLSGGEQQMLALASALVTHPKLLVCDELSLGLAPVIVDIVYGALNRAREAGLTIVLIEQYVDKALGIADNALIMRRGRQVWAGAADAARDTVAQQYLGSTPETDSSSGTHPQKEVESH